MAGILLSELLHTACTDQNCGTSYRTIADRILQMSLVPSRRLVKRDVSYEFMNRQMVWHAFTVSSWQALTCWY